MTPVRFLALSLIIALAGSFSFAQDAPKPSQSPPRVPFSAFRMKPILNPQLNKDVKTPALTIAPLKLVPPVKPKDARSPAVQKALEDIILSPQKAAPIPFPIVTSPPVTTAGIPVPPRKPLMNAAPADNLAMDRIVASPMEQTPVTPVVTERIAPEEAPAAKSPVRRIRDRLRFSSTQRTAGMAIGGGESERIVSRGLSRDAQNLRLGKLEEAEGVSPVLMPGQKVVMAAPDNPKTVQSGIPNDVIVFFQENSAELEVGQMDVLAGDVVGALQARADLNLEIVGYAEPQQGGADATQKLALSRALMIREYLNHQHIAADRLTVKGKADDTKVEPRDRVDMFFSQ